MHKHTAPLEPYERYFIRASDHNNCVICLVNKKGPMTQEEIGSYLGITKERASQLERLALEKFKKKLARALPQLYDEIIDNPDFFSQLLPSAGNQKIGILS